MKIDTHMVFIHHSPKIYEACQNLGQLGRETLEGSLDFTIQTSRALTVRTGITY